MTRATDCKRQARTHRNRPFAGRVRARSAGFARGEDGSLIIFSLFIFVLMLIIGGLSVDLMRFETTRTKLQNTVDRAALAAASLNQQLTPTEVVNDYFAKSGMSQFLKNVEVTEAINFRQVDVDTEVNVPTHFFNMVGIENLASPADSIAQESIGDVEISMVLDVSGSMNSYSRLANLKVAAKGFLDTIYDASEPNAVSTSIIPYATQVNAGSSLLPYFNIGGTTHDESHCVNFTSSAFDSASMAGHLHPSINPTSTPLEQTLHFDPWTDEHDSFDLGEYNDPSDFRPVCPNTSNREIQVWSTNKSELKDYVDGLTATGNTSTDIGTKWGVALLDPGSQPILSDMITSGDVIADLEGRPYGYDSGASMKILIVMTDGAHTSQYYMGDYRDGDSFVWRHETGGVVHYSIWWDGEDSEPITDVDPNQKYTFCDDWDWGYCDDWDYWYNPEFWFHAWSPNGISNNYQWRSEPFGGDDAVRMTWAEVWAEIPPEYFSDEVLYEMQSMYSSERNQYEYAIDYVSSSTKNTRFDNICQSVKDASSGPGKTEVVIFTIGLEVTTSNAARLASCASSPSHYYDVDNLDIADAFQSIASTINQLRLIQ
ncbi:MAG: Tad domain-containing protein [Rhodobacter sp.]|nr:Tad domain-containing protein [Rhodobacter sp.]